MGEKNGTSPNSPSLAGFSRLLRVRLPLGKVRRPLARQEPQARKSNRATSVDVDRFKEAEGTGQDWARTAYGNYYATSVPVYAAVRVRSEALARPPVVVYRSEPLAGPSATLLPRGHARFGGGAREARSWLPVGEAHPVQRLLDRVNPWYTRGQLWRATEIYLNLWGSVFWALERGEDGQWELWPLRPDRVRVLPDRQRYIRGYVYTGAMGPVAYTPNEMVWIRYFNPLEEYAGLSPMAALRLSADMGLDATKFNRNFFKNSAQPDLIFTTEETMNDEEVEEFYQRWESRYKGPGNAHRPAIASFIKDIKTLGFSHREMEFIQGLRWTLEDVSRAYGVPMPLLSDFQRATFSNVNAAERFFWRNTMVPEMRLLEEQINEKLLPLVGYPELRIEFDLGAIEALREEENTRVDREVKLLDRRVLTINEVRRLHNLPDVPWGDAPDAGEDPRPVSL
jgi:HK97 family phage portal protein